MILIGIDPDTKKSGFASYNKNNKALSLHNLSFFDIFDYLSILQADDAQFKVILEAGWLNKSNWHTDNKNKAMSVRIGNNTGSNHEVGRKIEEMLIYLKINYELRVPKTSKTDSKYFEKLTGIKKSNQDQRDAAMLVWGY